MPVEFTGDWDKLYTFLDTFINGQATAFISEDISRLAEETHLAILKALETHGASVGRSYGEVSESWYDARQEGIVGELRGSVSGVFSQFASYAGHNLAGHYTGAYASSIRLEKLLQTKERFETVLEPKKDVMHFYHLSNEQDLDGIPVTELAEILEFDYPHWRPVFENIDKLPAYNKLRNLTTLQQKTGVKLTP